MKLHCIHGNLQTKRVWEPLEGRFNSLGLDISLACEDLSEGNHMGFDQWTQEFCKRVERDAAGKKTFLLGYSLGGRLALHACLARPELWSGVIVVSADPGSSSPEQKKVQLEKDKQWAERFRSETMDSLLAEWDALPVFSGIPNSVPRNVDEFNPEGIGRVFDLFSKGCQRDLMPELRESENPPLLFISGEKDEKYTKRGKELAASCPAVRHKIIPNAGHRVPWENPNSFVEEILRFMRS
jgi:2-succinyl-6-hydroxy-2,4-cyclohexadiene-1-carboxylate synthase